MRTQMLQNPGYPRPGGRLWRVHATTPLTRLVVGDRPELGGVGVLMCYFSPKRSGRVGRFRPPKWPVSAAELNQIAARPTAPVIPIWRIAIDQYTHTPSS